MPNENTVNTGKKSPIQVKSFESFKSFFRVPDAMIQHPKILSTPAPIPSYSQPHISLSAGEKLNRYSASSLSKILNPSETASHKKFSNWL